MLPMLKRSGRRRERLNCTKMNIGDKVIVRSNNDEPLLIGFYHGEETFPNSSVPVVKDEQGGIWYCLGIIKPFSEELMAELAPLSPKEQWNKLSINYKRR